MTVDGVQFLISWRVINYSVSAFKKWGSGGGKRETLSSLSRHNFVLFGLQIKRPPTLVSLRFTLLGWLGDKAGRKCGLSNMSARKRRERREAERRPGCLFNNQTSGILELSTVAKSVSLQLVSSHHNLAVISVDICTKKPHNPPPKQFLQNILRQRGSKYNYFPLGSARSERLGRCNLLLQQRLS